MLSTLENIKADFADNRCGAGGLLAGLRYAHDHPGQAVTFEVRKATQSGSWELIRVEQVGLTRVSRKRTWRFAKNGELRGEGSFALVASWIPDQSVERAACALAIVLTHIAPGCVVFWVSKPGYLT